MNFENVPLGFGMALATNPPALNVYYALTDAEREDLLSKARNARSKEEMHDLINSLGAQRSL